MDQMTKIIKIYNQILIAFCWSQIEFEVYKSNEKLFTENSIEGLCNTCIISTNVFQTLKLFSERQPMWGGTVISLNQSSLELYNPKLPQCDSPRSWISFQEQVFTQPCHKQKITRKKNIVYPGDTQSKYVSSSSNVQHRIIKGKVFCLFSAELLIKSAFQQSYISLKYTLNTQMNLTLFLLGFHGIWGRP